MHSMDRLPDLFLLTCGFVAGPDCVVKTHHARCTGMVFYKMLDLRVVNGFEFFFIEEIFYPGFMIDDFETMLIESELVSDRIVSFLFATIGGGRAYIWEQIWTDAVAFLGNEGG